MRLNEVICSECSQVVLISASSVTFPFVCQDCQEAIDFQEKIAPPEGVTTAANESESESLKDDTATVENTTLLIEDLEKQVAATEEALSTSTKLIADLTTQLVGARELLELFDECGIEVTRELLSAGKENDILKARVRKLEGDNKQLWERDNELYGRFYKYWKKASFYENLGFWGRLFNIRYSGQLIDPRGF